MWLQPADRDDFWFATDYGDDVGLVCRWEVEPHLGQWGLFKVTLDGGRYRRLVSVHDSSLQARTAAHL